MEWKTAWSYLPINYNTTIGTVENIMQRTYIRNNLYGNKVKIKFSNVFSKEKLFLEKVVLGQRKPGTNKISEMIDILHHGNANITLGAGEEFYSDEFEWQIEPQTEIVLSVYIKEKCKIQSACSTWSARSWYTQYGVLGDDTKKEIADAKESREIYPFVEADVNKSNIIVGISEIKLYTDRKVATVALFGDSITHMSYYSDALLERVFQEFPGEVTILNRGIGGNRVLHDASYAELIQGNGSCFGKAAIKRFEEDVYGSDCPETVIILEGVNDMLHPALFGHEEETVSAKDLQAGLEALVQIAHRKGSKVYLGTVMPFRNNEFEWLPESEAVRLEFNEWIRSQTIADGVIDFAKEVQKEENPEYMKDELHIGDGLHPNREGGVAMAESIPMNWILKGAE